MKELESNTLDFDALAEADVDLLYMWNLSL